MWSRRFRGDLKKYARTQRVTIALPGRVTEVGNPTTGNKYTNEHLT